MLYPTTFFTSVSSIRLPWRPEDIRLKWSPFHPLGSPWMFRGGRMASSVDWEGAFKKEGFPHLAPPSFRRAFHPGEVTYSRDIRVIRKETGLWMKVISQGGQGDEPPASRSVLCRSAMDHNSWEGVWRDPPRSPFQRSPISRSRWKRREEFTGLFWKDQRRRFDPFKWV